MLDVFVYLRPESNGVGVESAIMSVVRGCGAPPGSISLVYLANIPGPFIQAHHTVERHYQTRLIFATHGAAALTPPMWRELEQAFGAPLSGSEDIIGAFEALRRFQWSPEELFGVWVDAADVAHVAGQTFKRVGGVVVVNPDIPALLHKNQTGTDIAVMVFRTRLGYGHFFGLIQAMRRELVERKLMEPTVPLARVVHVSRSPIEQLADARDYLMATPTVSVGIEGSSFWGYAIDHGLDGAALRGLVTHPIVALDDTPDWHVDIADLAEGLDYAQTVALCRRIAAQAVPPVAVAAHARGLALPTPSAESAVPPSAPDR